jgi:hypothetical protein
MRTEITITAIAAFALTAHAQTGRYWVTSENQPSDFIASVQGGSITSSFLPPISQGAIAVGPGNSIRTIDQAFGSSGIFPGTEWTKAGAPIMPISLNTAGIGAGRMIDGGFDGRNTYVVSGFDNFGATIGEVWRFGPNFDGAGAFMFNVGLNDQGITYDTATNTIWTSEYNLSGAVGMIKQWDLAGNLLFSFAAQRTDATGAIVDSERNTALAYDPSDDTIWFNAHVETSLTGAPGEFWQFDRNGNFLQAINPAQGVLYWGGEFNIPAPATAAIFAAAGLASARRRR